MHTTTTTTDLSEDDAAPNPEQSVRLHKDHGQHFRQFVSPC